MELSYDLLKQFARITNDQPAEKKEQTVYGIVKKIDDATYVKFDGSDLLTPVNSATDAEDGDRVGVLIKNHSADLLCNFTSPSVGNAQFGAYKEDVIKKFDAVYTTFLTAEKADLAYAKIGSLEATNGRIDTLSGDLANYKEIVAGKFTAAEGRIDVLTGDFASYKTIVADNFTAANGRIDTLSGDFADYKEIVADNFTATNGQITNLSGEFSSFQTTMSQEMITAKGWMLEGAIGDAQISKVSANKLGAGTIDTAIVTVAGTDGRLQIQDNTIQIKDANRVRVQIGKDAGGDYSMSVWDASGQLIWDALGATENTIQRKIIRDRMVADDAAIQALKIDFQSFDTALTQQGVTISGTVVQVGSKTLNVALSEQTQTISDNYTSLKNYTDTAKSAAISVAASDATTKANNALKGAKEYADAIEIGGRNLIHNSTFKKNGAYWGINSCIASYGTDVALGRYICFHSAAAGDCNTNRIHQYAFASGGNHVVGQTYSLSFYAKTSSTTKIHAGNVYHLIPFDVTTEWKKYTVSYESKNTGSLTFYVDTANVDLYLSQIKLELGTKATDWTPAPEDMEAEHHTHAEQLSSHETRITANENSIKLKVATSDFNSYKTTVNGELTSAKSRLSTAESSITAMQGKIALKVEQTDIDSAMQNLHIGGRNLLPETRSFDECRGMAKVAETYQDLTVRGGTLSGSQISVCQYDFTGFSLGDVYTLSFYAKGNATQLHAFFYGDTGYVKAKTIAVSQDGTIMHNSYSDGNALFHVTNEWKRYWVTWQLDFTGDIGVHKYILLRTDGSSAGQNVYVCGMKLEKGTKATDWTPAPEDIDASITAVDNKFANYSTTSQMQSAINLAKDSITSTVSKTYATQTYADGIKATADSAKKEVYASFSGNGVSKAYCLLCQIKTNQAYINTPTVIEINQRGYGYSLCEIKFASSNSTDPALYSIRKTGTPQWRIVKSATSTWDVYVKKSESWDAITVVGFTKGTVPSVTWKCLNADLPNGSTAATQLAGLYTVDSTSGGTAGSDALITSGAAHSAISSVQTIATQTAEKFNWIVKSGTSATDFTLTDRTAQLITEKLTIKDSTGASTIISGGKMDINKIFAQHINATGTIRGVKLEGATGSFSGSVTTSNIIATGGKIANFTISGGYLFNGISIGQAGSCGIGCGSALGANDDWMFWAGNGLFRVDKNGQAWMSNGHFTGDVNSTSLIADYAIKMKAYDGGVGRLFSVGESIDDPRAIFFNMDGAFNALHINSAAVNIDQDLYVENLHATNIDGGHTTINNGANQTPLVVVGCSNGESSIRYCYYNDYNNAWVVGPGAGTADMNKFGFYHCPTSATKAYINYNGEIVSLLGGLSQFRAVNGNYGFMIRNDGANTYFLLTGNGDPYGGWRNTFPFIIGNGDGMVQIQTGLIFPTNVGVQSPTGPILRTFNATNYSNLTAVGNTSSQASIYTSNRVWKNGSTSTYFSTTSSSDKRLKEAAGDMASYESFFEALRPVPFKYHEGLYDAPNRKPKIQWGFYAQDVVDAFERNGINWHDQELVVVEDGDLTAEELKYVQPGTLLKMNYQNLTALNTHMIQKHSKQISRIESRQESEQNQISELRNTIADLRAEVAELRRMIYAA